MAALLCAFPQPLGRARRNGRFTASRRLTASACRIPARALPASASKVMPRRKPEQTTSRGFTGVCITCAFVASPTRLTRAARRLSHSRAARKGPYGIRTRAAAVRGRCPRPLDEWAERGLSVATSRENRPRRNVSRGACSESLRGESPHLARLQCADPLRGRLMVGRLTLDQVVKVRVLAPQPGRAPLTRGSSFSPAT
jgi:hypothetical protein